MANNVKFKWFDIAGSTATANINRINGVNEEDLLYVKSTTPGTGSNVVSLPYLLRTRGVNWYGAATPPFVAYTDGTNRFATRHLVDIGGAILSILKDPTGDTGNYWSVTAFQENTGAQGFKIKINTDAIKGDVAPSYNALGFYTSATAAGSSSPQLITSYTPASALNVDFEKYLTGQMSAGGRLSLNVNAVTSVTSSSTDNNIPTSKAVVDYVDSAVAGLAGAMHYLGQKTVTVSGGTISVSGVSSPQSGDVVVADISSTSPTAEYIYNGTAWEELGSEGIYWTKAGTITTDGIILLNNLSSSSLGAGSVFSHADSSGIASSAVKTQQGVYSIQTDSKGHIIAADLASSSDIPKWVAKADTLGMLRAIKHTAISATMVSGTYADVSGSTAVAINAPSTTAGKYYAIEVDKDGRAFVNVPWSSAAAANNGILNVKAGGSATGQIFTANQSGNSTLTISGSNGINISAASGGSNTARTITVKGPDLQINGTSVTTPASSNASVVINAEAKDYDNNVEGNGVISFTYTLGDGGSGTTRISTPLQTMTWEELS